MKNKTVLFSILYLITYIAYGFSASQIIPYLTTLGFDAMQRGVIISVSSIVAIVLQIVIGYLSDRFKTIKKFMILGLLLYGIFATLVYQFPISQFIISLILVSLMTGFFNLNFGFMDSFVLESGEKTRKLYSFIRAFGSLGWAIGCMIVSIVINRLGYQKIGLIVLIIVLISISISFLIEDVINVDNNESITMTDYISLVSQKPYVILVIILFLINATQTLNTYAVVDKMIYVGADASHIGIRSSIQGLIEIPVFVFGVYISSKLKPIRMLQISCLAFAVQFILFGLSTNPIQMVSLTVLQILTYPMLIMSQRNLLYRLSPNGLKTSGQLFAQSVAVSGSALLIPFLSGVITTSINVDASVYFGAITALIALVLTLSLIKYFK